MICPKKNQRKKQKVINNVVKNGKKWLIVENIFVFLTIKI